MDSLFVCLVFLPLIIHSRSVESGSCPTGCNCGAFSINCCESEQYLHIPIIGYDNATKLSLKNCPSLDITKQTFQNCNTLEEITITRTTVTYVDAYAFVGLTKLKSLFLNELNLSSANIHHLAFQDLHIQHLDLSSNNLRSIHRQMFSGLKNLSVLNLSRNRIGLIQNQAFESLLQLSVLNLDHNDLKTVTPLWFKIFSNYSTLQISLVGNNLTSECRFRGVELTENQWFAKSITPKALLITEGTTVPTCSTPTFIDPYQEIYVKQSLSVVLPCSANSLPLPTLSWLLPTGQEATPSTPQFSISNGMLIITRVWPSNSGLYVCVATNTEGSAVALTRLLVVPNSSTTFTTDLITPNRAAKKASLILLIIFIVILSLPLCFFLVYMLLIVFKRVKEKHSTGFEFTHFVDTPNILSVPENPQPMPHL
ncbi:hypothetical protein FKM82_007820 [Ascaphus truei]